MRADFKRWLCQGLPLLSTRLTESASSFMEEPALSDLQSTSAVASDTVGVVHLLRSGTFLMVGSF